HFVRVDAYPTVNGKIVEGLKPEDFEILEDGKPQTIESFDFLKFDTFTPDAERRDPVSQQAGFDMAADPRYRLFVVYVDMALSRPDLRCLCARGPELPRRGIVDGRISSDNRPVYTHGGRDANACAQGFSRLAQMDFEQRYRELLEAARHENVAFYVISPGGLQ